MKQELKKLTDKLKNEEITVIEYNRELAKLVRKERLTKYGIDSGRIRWVV